MACFILPFLIVGGFQSSPYHYTVEYLHEDVILTQTIPLDCWKDIDFESVQ